MSCRLPFCAPVGYKSCMTMEEFRECPEVVWLKSFQKQVDFEAMAVEELTKSQDIHQFFFSGDAPTEPASTSKV